MAMALMRILLLVLLTLGLGLSSVARAAPTHAVTPPPCHEAMVMPPDEVRGAGITRPFEGAQGGSTEAPLSPDRLMSCCIGCAPAPVLLPGALIGASPRVESLQVFQTASPRLVGLAVPPEPGRPRPFA
ncbi:MAG: hypothetical protein Q7V15_00430 [Phenylobacterium sp.]|uniref:hypothetical protein n=1 Tax=Phenylobacterium sp. TaxID=1871053 RepID=UPI00271898B8|nr:hypothetical protein [Phenylobacterium sp.]MDO8899802.1 hypothetical protein [Phenylobacterium sp.]